MRAQSCFTAFSASFSHIGVPPLGRRPPATRPSASSWSATARASTLSQTGVSPLEATVCGVCVERGMPRRPRQPQLGRHPEPDTASRWPRAWQEKELLEPALKATEPLVVHVLVEMLCVTVEPVGTCTLDTGGGRRHAPVAQPLQMWSRSPAKNKPPLPLPLPPPLPPPLPLPFFSPLAPAASLGGHDRGGGFRILPPADH